MQATPAFARAYPKNEILDRLVTTFEEGDYQKVNEGASALLADEDTAVRTAAADLISRTKVDPTAKVLFALAAFLLVGLTAYWIKHAGPDPHTPPPKPTIEYVK